MRGCSLIRAACPDDWCLSSLISSSPSVSSWCQTPPTTSTNEKVTVSCHRSCEEEEEFQKSTFSALIAAANLKWLLKLIILFIVFSWTFDKVPMIRLQLILSSFPGWLCHSVTLCHFHVTEASQQQWMIYKLFAAFCLTSIGVECDWCWWSKSEQSVVTADDISVRWRHWLHTDSLTVVLLQRVTRWQW